MPNLPTHLSLAMKTAARVGHPAIDSNLDNFLLGCTSPDIRIMTKWKRDQTHFAPLAIDRVGTGVDGLLEAHPSLADSSRVGDATKAFLSGYFTHLVADETWILGIYHRYFDGQHGPEDRVQANIWDRALQLDMDKASREELGDMEQVRALLERSEHDVGVAFIGSDILSQWREWVTKFTTWEFTWDRLRFATRRMYQDDPHASEMVEEFLQGMPDSLKGVYDTISKGTIAEYREKVIAESTRSIREYLVVPESD